MSNPPASLSVSVIIVTWNSAAYLPRCLECLQAQTYRDFEVIVIDNASTDGTLSILDSLPHTFSLRVQAQGKNEGFATANNVGAHLAQGTWLALLNPDAYPEADWLETLVLATQKFPDFTFFASRQIQADEPELLDGAGDVFHISGLAWRRFTGERAERLGLETEEVFSPCAAAALYLRQAFLQVGGFDEDFFSYHEDVDLGFRLRLEGFRSIYIPEAVVRHVGSASTGKKSAFAIYHGHRNLIWNYVKNMPTLLFWLCLPYHLLMNLFFLLYFSSKGQARAIWRAKLDGARGLRAMLRKRKEIQDRRRVPVMSLYRLMNRNWLAPYKVRMKSRYPLKDG